MARKVNKPDKDKPFILALNILFKSCCKAKARDFFQLMQPGVDFR